MNHTETIRFEVNKVILKKLQSKRKAKIHQRLHQPIDNEGFR